MKNLLMKFCSIVLLLTSVNSAYGAYIQAREGKGPGNWKSLDGSLYARIFVNDSGTYICQLVKEIFSSDVPEAILTGIVNGNDIFFTGEQWTGKLVSGKALNLERSRGTQKLDFFPYSFQPPSLLKKAPENAVVIFDGTNIDMLGKVEKKEWLTASGPASNWKLLPEGWLEVVPDGCSVISTEVFGDIFLHLEFRLLGPETNGGVYIQSRYEINIKDSYGQIAEAPCGALGNVLEPEIALPAVNMALPPLEWQTLDIEFRAPRFGEEEQGKSEHARITVILNGTMIYDDVEIHQLKGAAGRLGEAATGPLYLQEHGTAYQFRNIWIVNK